MKLQVTIGNNFSVNTTLENLGFCFSKDDTVILKDMLNMVRTLRNNGESVSQYINGNRYAITFIE